MENDSKTFWEDRWESERFEAVFACLEKYYQWKDEVLDVFRCHGVKTVCDAACGYGAYSLAFASNGFQVSGFDISPSAVEITRRGLEKYGLTASLKVASILSTGYGDESFDGVIASSVLDHLTTGDAQKALSELYRITSPGGLILVSFDTPEESDQDMEHEVLADGSLRYAEGTSRSGMIFHPYNREEISLLLAGKQVIYAHTNEKGEQIRILKK